MSDLKAQLEISADAKGVETGVNQAKRSLASLGVTAGKAGADAAKGINTISTVSARASKAIDATVARLQLSAATINKTTVETKLYELSQRGASKAQLDAAKAAFATVDSYKAQQAALARVQDSAARYGAMIATLSIGAGVALFAIAKNSVQALDAFNDLSDATGASIENISALDRVARETGGNFETVSSTLVKFNQVLNKTGEGSEEAARVFKALGLSAKELKAVDPAEALRRTAVALSQFADDGTKARAVQTLFGKSIQEAAPFLKDLSEQTSLVGRASTKAAQDAEAFNKRIFQLTANLQDAARTITSNLIPAVSELADEFLVGMKHSTGFMDAILTFGTINPFRSQAGNLKELRSEMDGLVKDRERYVRAGSDTRAIDEAMRNTGRQIDYLKDLQARMALSSPGDVGDAVSRRLRPPSVPSLPLGEKAAKGSKTDPEAEGKRMLESLQKQIEKTKELTVAEQLIQDLRQNRLGKIGPDLEKRLRVTASEVDATQAVTKSLAERLRAQEAAASMQERADDQALLSVSAQIQANDALREEIELIGLEAPARMAVEQARLSSAAALKEEELVMLRNSEASETQISVIEREIALLRERAGLLGQRTVKTIAAEELQATKDYAKDLNADLKHAFSDAFASTKNPMKAFGESLFTTVGSRVSAALAQSLADNVLGAIGMGSPAKSGGGLVSFIASLFGGPRANGGPVNPSQFNLVGERGPELFVPHTAGMIIPNHAMGGEMNITIVNNTSAPIGRVTQQQISPTERALIIEEAVQAGAAQFNDPNSRTSKTLAANYRMQRNR